jgi:SAM-dependent methyltransferase
LIDRLPDRVLGIETASQVPQKDLGFDSDRCWYEASPWRTLSSVLPRDSVSVADVFADFGCGKGRVLLQAARYPFGRVVGVELSPEVAQVARHNVARLRRYLRCRDVEVVTADIVDFPIPNDLSVAFCYNPVRGVLFQRLLENLSESLARNPRPFQLIYHNPTMQHLVMQKGWREERRVVVQQIGGDCDVAVFRRS